MSSAVSCRVISTTQTVRASTGAVSYNGFRNHDSACRLRNRWHHLLAEHSPDLGYVPRFARPVSAQDAVFRELRTWTADERACSRGGPTPIVGPCSDQHC